jgi:hypothetical protein
MSSASRAARRKYGRADDTALELIIVGWLLLTAVLVAVTGA